MVSNPAISTTKRFDKEQPPSANSDTVSQPAPAIGQKSANRIDAIDWLRGRIQPFDPAGVIGLLAFTGKV